MKNLLLSAWLSSLVLLPLAAKKIASPHFSEQHLAAYSQGSTLFIEGSGFINNYPQAHRLILSSDQNTIKLKASTATTTELSFDLPVTIDYGDYDLLLKLKTRYLKSKTVQHPERLLLRPSAPEAPILEPAILSDLSQAQLGLKFKQKPGLSLELPEPIEIGANPVRAYYYEQGYKSLLSDASYLYYLPEEDFARELVVAKEEPLEVYARNLSNGDLIDVSDITQKTILDTALITYYVSSLDEQKYLSKTIFSSPVKFSKIHVKNPEYVYLYNHSSKEFPLAGCSLSDSIMTRYTSFEQRKIAAGSPFKVEANLGLNDSGGDELTFSCNCDHPIFGSASSLIGADLPACQDDGQRQLFKFVYSELDEEGFAI